MSIVEQAKTELENSNFSPEDTEVILKIMRMFFDQWDSGGAVSVMVPVLDRLLKGLPLAPLSGNDEEWMCGHFDDDLCQNIRCGSVFKNIKDGRIYDIDNPAWDGSFPYQPADRNLNPVIEFTTTQ